MSPWVRELYTVLADLEFAPRYYALVDRANAECDERCTYKAFCEAFDDGDRFTHCRSERFFQVDETAGDWRFALKLAYAHARMELIFVILRGEECLGAPVTLLAYESALLRDPEFTRTPRAPKVRLGDPGQVRESISVALELFRDATNAIVAHDGWPRDSS